MFEAARSLFMNHDADKHFFDTLKIPQYTPDLPRLQQFATQFLLSYSPAFLEAMPREAYTVYGAAFTDDHNFIMWKKILGDKSFGIPMTFGESVPEDSYLKKMKYRREGQLSFLYPPGRIGGKLCLIRNPGHWLKELDNLALNTIYFTRQRVRVMIPHGIPGRLAADGVTRIWEPDIAYTNAWCYVGAHEYWQDQIERSEDKNTLIAPINAFRAKNKTIGEYYYFTKEEYNCPETIDWKDSTWSYGKEGSDKKRRKRLQNLNKDLNVKPVRKSLALPKLF